jgi:hypothetical protein
MERVAENRVSSDAILQEIERLRSGSLVKDILLALVPLLVAVLSIYFSNRSAERQIAFSNTQLAQTREIENAKLLESFSDRILNGGKEAELARIALDTIMLTDIQRIQLAAFFETESGGSDSPENEIVRSEEIEVDAAFGQLLTDLFATEREVRARAYTETRLYLLANNSGDLLDQMIAKVETDPFNIKGRSNVLSIWASLPKERLNDRRSEILEFLDEIQRAGAVNPAYAVGPQTQGWTKEIRAALSDDPQVRNQP